MSFLREYDHLKIQMKDILSATNNFDSAKVIGGGGFGRVYKGELSLPEGPVMVAFKKLDRRLGQGNTEFWKEVMMLSKYKHENLISLMHYCIEGNEMILGYEYASRGSLDRYLSDASLTWIQRLKICVGAARGLNYLHDPRGAHVRVIHRDIKSGNLLLDENWMAKVSDFGLSKAGPASQEQTVLVSNAVGTPGYCDPLYWEMGFLSKESDVYSFGVVLFEILCGRLCCEYNKGELTTIFVPKWRRCYEEKTLDEIIFPVLKEQMDPGSLNAFSAIAYQCVKKAREQRPMMAEVVKKLELALQEQAFFEDLGKKVDFETLIKIANGAVTPLSYVSRSHLYTLFIKGFLVDDGKMWIGTNMNGEISEVISAIKCITADKLLQTTEETSRFPYILKGEISEDFVVEVKTLFLSPNVTYAVNLVFKVAFENKLGSPQLFKYKLEDETQYWASSKGEMREDGWLIIELYQFTSYQNEHNFKIEFIRSGYHNSDFANIYYFEGIEFRPVEQVGFEYQVDNNKVDKLTLKNSDIDWEDKLPTDYAELLKLSKDDLQHTTKRELYFLFRKGFLIDNDSMWFSINKSLKNRLMIPATSFLLKKEWEWRALPESRFKVVGTSSAQKYTRGFTIACEINSQLLSYQTNYSCHLIYKWFENDSRHSGLLLNGEWYGHGSKNIFLYTQHRTPCIKPKDEKSFQRSYDARILKFPPKQRKDGWMEFQLCEVSSEANGAIRLDYTFSFSRDRDYFDIAIEGIELRPFSSKMDEKGKNFVGEDDLQHIYKLVREKDGGLAWITMMDRSTSNMSYQAWKREPETGPAQYRSRTVYEDMTPELMRDFSWDDELRLKWDDMLLEAKTIEECPKNGTMVVKWVRKFPFFCSDREYIIGRRIWESGKTYYCVTKGVQYPSVPRQAKPRRVDLYYSSWSIRAVESRKGDGQMTACEVLLFHHEDIGIPWEIAKLGVRQGMWAAVKKIDHSLRWYQKQKESGTPLSHCAYMARITTKVSPDRLRYLGYTSNDSQEIESFEQVADDEKRLGKNLPKVLVTDYYYLSSIFISCLAYLCMYYVYVVYYR